MKTETRQTRLLIKFADPTVFLFIYVSLQILSALTREQMKSGALEEPPPVESLLTGSAHGARTWLIKYSLRITSSRISGLKY